MDGKTGSVWYEAGLTQQRTVRIGPLALANDRPFVLIAGPCQLESRAPALEMSQALGELTQRLGLGLIYKDLLRQGEPDLRHRGAGLGMRSEEHTSELQSLMRISYAVFCLKKKNEHTRTYK